MSENAQSELDTRVLAEIRSAFPVVQSPYCEIGERLGVAESDVLESVERLRSCGAVARIGADFRDLSALELEAPSQDEMDLAELMSGDLPYSEHPFAELANELQLRGIETDESWVIDRVSDWVSSGVITRFAASVA